MNLFGKLPQIRALRRVPGSANVRSIQKPRLEQTIDPERLSYMYRVAPGPGSKEVVDIVNLLFFLRENGYPAMTLPEAIYWYLCEKHQVSFLYQTDFMGGRSEIGGAVIDFLLPDYGVVIYVNGLYWHEKPDVAERDLAAMIAVIGETVGGVKISAAVRISDVRLQSLGREEAFALSVAGIESYP